MNWCIKHETPKTQCGCCRNDRKDELPVDKIVMPTLADLAKERTYKTIALLIKTLANECAANEEKIIDLLTKYLFEEEEAKKLKELV